MGQFLFLFLPSCSTPPRKVHVTDQLHLHLHHLPYPASFRRAHATHTQVRNLNSRIGPGGQRWGVLFLFPKRGGCSRERLNLMPLLHLASDLARILPGSCLILGTNSLPLIQIQFRPLPHSCPFNWSQNGFISLPPFFLFHYGLVFKLHAAVLRAYFRCGSWDNV